jgi:hypothetical protein
MMSEVCVVMDESHRCGLLSSGRFFFFFDHSVGRVALEFAMRARKLSSCVFLAGCDAAGTIDT